MSNITICIKMNPKDTTTELCAICNGAPDLFLGPALYLDGTDKLVCSMCGKREAPELAKICMLDLEIAAGFKEVVETKWNDEEDEETESELL